VLRSGADRRHPLCQWAAGEAELGLQIVRRTQRAVSKNKPLTRKPLSGATARARPVVVQKGLGDRNDGPLRRTFERSAKAVRCQRGRARLEKAKIPQGAIPGISLSARTRDPLQLALHGGGDYELLFTVPPRKAKLLPKSFSRCGFTPMGKSPRAIVAGAGRERPSESIHARRWDPFRKKL